MYGPDINTLNVYIAPGGQPNSRGSAIYSLTYNQGNKWRMSQVDIAPSGDYQVLRHNKIVLHVDTLKLI